MTEKQLLSGSWTPTRHTPFLLPVGMFSIQRRPTAQERLRPSSLLTSLLFLLQFISLFFLIQTPLLSRALCSQRKRPERVSCCCSVRASREGSRRPVGVNRRTMASRGLTEEAVTAVCKEGDAVTKDFMMQQTMIRVKDPAKSLAFYTGVLGMTLLQKIDFHSMHFTNYFLGYEKKSDIPEDINQRTAWTFSRRATIELTHNWGSEKCENLSYNNGNTEPRGFGHIGIAVPNLEKACKLFEEQGVTFVKKPHSGKVKDVAFIQDPDGYWIEILTSSNMVSLMSSQSDTQE